MTRDHLPSLTHYGLSRSRQSWAQGEEQRSESKPEKSFQPKPGDRVRRPQRQSVDRQERSQGQDSQSDKETIKNRDVLDRISERPVQHKAQHQKDSAHLFHHHQKKI